MLKHRRCPPPKDDKEARVDEISPKPSSTVLPQSNPNHRQWPSEAIASSPLPSASSTHKTTPYDRINKLFTRNTTGETDSPSTISRLASSLISPIRSKSAKSFLQTRIPRYRASRSASRGRSTTSDFFGILRGSESWTSFHSTRSRSRSKEYYRHSKKNKHDTWDHAHLDRLRKLSRSRENYPRANKRKQETWDLIDLERLKKLSIVNQDYKQNMAVISSIVAGSCPLDASPSSSNARGRSPQRFHRGRSLVPTARRSTVTSKSSSSRPHTEEVIREAPMGRRPTSLTRQRDESPSPQGRGCIPRSDNRTREPQYPKLERGLRSFLVIGVSAAVPLSFRSFSRRDEEPVERPTTTGTKLTSRPPTPVPKLRSKRSASASASLAVPAQSTGAVRKQVQIAETKAQTLKSDQTTNLSRNKPKDVATAGPSCSKSVERQNEIFVNRNRGESLPNREATPSCSKCVERHNEIFVNRSRGESLPNREATPSRLRNVERQNEIFVNRFRRELILICEAVPNFSKSLECQNDIFLIRKRGSSLPSHLYKDLHTPTDINLSNIRLFDYMVEKRNIDESEKKVAQAFEHNYCHTHISRFELHKIKQNQMESNRATYTSARPDLHLKCNRGSHSSDTSSAYSGSDTMTSLHSSALDGDEVDLSGLVESIVDSDEDDLVESMESLNVRDAVRECLEKDPSERTEEDIETLLEFTQGLKAFTNITLAVRRALCSVMVFAVVDKAGTIVMSDGEELDSWSVLINGHVEIDHGNGEKEELQMGDSFGILPTMDKLYHRGVMKTKCNDCQFVCITQTDYYRIQHQGEENTKRHEEDGKVVMVTELRQIGPDTNVGSAMKRGHVVIRGTIERLLLQLVEENSMTDPTYVEDFLLTHRTFIRNPQEVAGKLLSWFESEEAGTSASPQEIRDRVTRVVLLWVNNHFTDFETDTEMMEFLETFESGLERKNLLSQLRLLHIACAAKARTRTVTLARSSRDENLNFCFVGGYERGGYGIFISKVEKNSKPDDVGLKRGDQILEVNGQSFEHVTNARAMEIIMGSTHLSITVKSNLLSFKEMIQSPDSNSPRPRTNPRRICANDIAKLHGNADARPAIIRLSAADILSHDQVDCCPSPYRDRESSTTSGTLVGGIATASHFVAGLLGTSGSSKKDSSTISVASSNNSTSSSSSSMSTSTGHQKGGFMTLGPKRRLQKALIKMNLLPKNAVNSTSVDAGDALLIPSEGGQQQDDGRTTNSAGNNASASTSSNYNTGGNLAGMYHSRSNPDLTSTIYYEDTRQMDYPEHVLKVYKSDQTCKYLLINKETTAHEVVMLALQEFGIHETSSNFSLCEVSVGEGGMIKQRRLPEQLQNLAERIGLSSRYYLKTNGITETLVPDELALDLVRESTVHFLQLNANEVAIQLTFQDFAIFRQIESTEYVDDLFELKSKYGVPMLKQFAELVNREMFWVVTEVCSEHNIVRRMKIVKQFIKIARHCKECRNFNSMFAIVSGLGHAAVTRLRQTWEKLPSKYQKLFADLQDLMDPSRNMSKYRQLVSAEFLAQHPIIPFYPVVKKDLTFIHLGNDTRVESLINFEKLRMIAKEVRILTHMCSSTYDLLTMLEFKGQPPSSAMVALNQMSVSSGPHHIHGSAGQATVKRRKKSTAAPNPKKMFEEAQMVRRVKAYLNNMKVITDEDVLHGLSHECEPSATSSGGGGGGGGSTGGGGGGSISGGSAPSSVTIRKRHPSPTLSTTSSTSSTSEGRKGGLGPKFGTASPQAVKKILSLSEPTKTRPYQPRHPGIMLPLVGHPHALHYSLHSSISPSPSPGAHRRMGSGTGVPVSGSRAVHERSHSDTPTPLPSVDLSVESSSVTSFSNLPLRKTLTSGSVTSSDSGHGSYVQPDVHLNYTDSSTSGGLYHLNVQLSSNVSTSPKQQRRHSAIHAPGFYYNTMTLPTSPTIVTAVNQLDHHSAIVGRKPSPTPPPPLPHPKSSLDERMMGLSLQQQYHHSQPPPLPPPSLHTQQMKNGNAVTGGMCVDGSLSFGPATVRNLQYLPLPPPPPLAPHPTQQQQQQQQALQQHLQQQHHNSQYHASRNVGYGVLTSTLVPPAKGPRYPPSYTVAAHMARLHRLGRAHSLERVANTMQGGAGNTGSGSAGSYYQHELGDEDEDSETQVSAV